LLDGLPAFVAIVEREVVHIHSNEPVDALRIEAAGELNRIRHRFFTMVEGVLNALPDVFADPLHHFLPQVALNHVAAERKRKTRFLPPPLAEVEHFVQSELAICQLAFVNQKTGFELAFLHFVQNFVERHDLVLDLRLEQAEGKKRCCERAWNRYDHLYQTLPSHSPSGNAD